MKIWPIWQIK